MDKLFFEQLLLLSLLLLLIKEVGSARLRESDTLSVQRPQPHNTNLSTERREREK